MRRAIAAALTIGALMLGAAPALAHHGLAQEFDMNKRITVKGKVTKVFWQNPHVYYSLDVTDNTGKIKTLNVESVPVASMRAAGLTSKKLQGGGQDVTVEMYPGTKDPNVAWGINLKYADGSFVTFEGFKE